MRLACARARRPASGASSRRRSCTTATTTCFSNTVPLVLIGWVLLLSGVRAWLTVTAIVVVIGGLASWVLAPAGLIVGASGLVLRLARLPARRARTSRAAEVDRRCRPGAVLLRHARSAPCCPVWGTASRGSRTPATSLPASSPARCCTRTRRQRADWRVRPTRAPQRRPYPDRRGSAPLVDAPIGMFDSGVGGLTVARAVLDQLPHEALHYVGDTANGPYGPTADRRGPGARARGHGRAGRHRRQGTGHRLQQRVSAACLRDARERYDVPGRRGDPAGGAACGRGHPQRPGRRHRHGRHRSPAAPTRTRSRPRPASRSPARPARGSPSSSSAAITSGRQLLGLAESYLAPLNAADVDTLVLGCTHYPLLTGLLSIVMGDAGHARLQRRRDRQGRLPGAHRAPTCCAPTTPPPPSTCSAPPAARSRSPGSAGASSGLRSPRWSAADGGGAA